jgi:hypothetical protein
LGVRAGAAGPHAQRDSLDHAQAGVLPALWDHARAAAAVGSATPDRRDSAEVIGAALLHNARGMGHRRIAAQLQRRPGTVRG